MTIDELDELCRKAAVEWYKSLELDPFQWSGRVENTASVIRSVIAPKFERLQEENQRLFMDSENYRGKCGCCGTANMDMLTDTYCAACRIAELEQQVAELRQRVDPRDQTGDSLSGVTGGFPKQSESGE